MSLDFRFAVISDLHIALPHTVWDGPNRLHLVEVSIPVFEEILQRLASLDLDFLLLPGDLTQHGEAENHRWVADRLAQLPYPTYVIPGNHDIPTLHRNEQSIGFAEFPSFYRDFGYGSVGGTVDGPGKRPVEEQTDRHYYSQEILPGLRLIALNSNVFDTEGNQIGRIDSTQMAWLIETLEQSRDELVMVMVHHNVLEHMPDQTEDPLGKRYILENAPELLTYLRRANVQIVLTGHLHIQNIVQQGDIYDITTGSLVSYPHPYRIMQVQTDRSGQMHLSVQSDRVEAVPEWETLLQMTRELMDDRSQAYMLHLLTHEPWQLPLRQAVKLVPHLRGFWANFAAGDAIFDLPQLPDPIRQYFERFSSPAQRDNVALLPLLPRKKSTVGRSGFVPPLPEHVR